MFKAKTILVVLALLLGPVVAFAAMLEIKSVPNVPHLSNAVVSKQVLDEGQERALVIITHVRKEYNEAG